MSSTQKRCNIVPVVPEVWNMKNKNTKTKNKTFFLSLARLDLEAVLGVTSDKRKESLTPNKYHTHEKGQLGQISNSQGNIYKKYLQSETSIRRY